MMAEAELRRLLGEHGFSIANLSYHLREGGKFFEYGMVIKNRDRRNADVLSRRLSTLPEVLESGRGHHGFTPLPTAQRA